MYISWPRGHKHVHKLNNEDSIGGFHWYNLDITILSWYLRIFRGSSIGFPWAWETPVSRTAVRTIYGYISDEPMRNISKLNHSCAYRAFIQASEIKIIVMISNGTFCNVQNSCTSLNKNIIFTQVLIEFMCQNTIGI